MRGEEGRGGVGNMGEIMRSEGEEGKGRRKQVRGRMGKK